MLSFLSVLASLVLVIASLYWAKAVLVPLALALMLTFLLQPIVAVLHRRGLGHTPAAVLVVMLLGLVLGAVGGGWSRNSPAWRPSCRAIKTTSNTRSTICRV